MSSELRGGGGDRPDGRADQPGEGGDNPFQRVSRDVNYVPASAGWKPDSGISRADYYKHDGDGPAKGAETADANSRGAATAPGSREGTGAVPGNAPPARSEGAGPQSPASRGHDQGRENDVPADKTNDAQAVGRDPGGDRSTGPVAPPGKTPPGGHDGHQPPDSGDPPTPGTPGHDRGGILHGHSEFHGQKLDLYSDGTRWVGGDAVRAAQAEAAKKQADGQPEPARHGIADVPQMRDLGVNTHGKSPDVHLGETSDQRTFAEQMTGEGSFGEARRREALREGDDSPSGKAGRALDRLIEHGDDVHDGISSETESANDFFLHGPGPTGAYALHSDHPAYEAAPSQGVNLGDAVGGTVLVIAAAMATAKHVLENHRREH